MKNIFKLVLPAAIVLVLLTGCNKWLEVQPSDQVSDEQLFQSYDGFYNAVNGVYQQLSASGLYGRHLTWGMNSALGQDYNPSYINAEFYYLMYNDYTRATSIAALNEVWSNAYNVIANCNKIIGEISKTSEDLFPMKAPERNLILGEAKAVRALLHFELVRLYAPAPINNRDASIIPYQTIYPSHFTAPAPTRVVMDSIIKDLEEAQVLVAENDTLSANNRQVMSYGLQSLLSGSNTPKGGIFFNFRMHRMNYVAIQALLARVHLYNGDKEKALEKAGYVYTHFGPNGRLKWWTFTPSSNTQGASMYHKLANDLILAFYDPNLISKINAAKQNYYTFALAPEVATWFPGSERDYRYNLIDGNKVSYKWLENTSTAQYVSQQNLILPVIRMSEMYLIYSEALFDAGMTTDALRVLNELRYARGKTTTFSNTAADAFYNELFDEYRREFIVEGQTIFNHKRLNRAMQVGTRIIEMDQKFVMPVPDGEFF